MGVYYGLGNTTKKIRVSHYWKGDPYCDIHQVMHRYHWDINDDIFSAGGCSYYIFNHNEDDNIMYVIEQDLSEAVHKSKKTNKSEDDIICHVGFGGYESEFEKSNDLNLSDHAPIWYNNKCMVCQYVFDKNNI